MSVKPKFRQDPTQPDFETVQKLFRDIREKSDGELSPEFEAAVERSCELIPEELWYELDELNNAEGPDTPEFKQAYDDFYLKPAKPAWKIHSFQEIVESPTAEPLNWIIEGLLLADTGTLVSGHPHAGKSLGWLAAAIDSVSHGKVWGQFPSKAKRVLYIETEDPKPLVDERIRALKRGLPSGALAEGFFCAVTGPFDLVTNKADLFELVNQVKPDWLVLSTLQGLIAGRDWKSQKDMGPVNAILVRLSRLCPIVVLTHSPWDKESKRAAGSVTQAANFATCLHFEKTGSVIKVTVDSKLSAKEQPFKLEMKTEDLVSESGSIKTEVRSVDYQGTSKKELIQNYWRKNPDANAADVAAEFEVSERYARECRP